MTAVDDRPIPPPAEEVSPVESVPAPYPGVTGRPAIRRIQTATFDDRASLGAALLSSFALVVILYFGVLPLSGTLGFLLCWFAAFLVLYGALVAMTNPLPIVVDRLVVATLWAVVGVIVLALGSTVWFIFQRGYPAFVHPNFYTRTMAGVSPTDPLTKGGILHALVGTLLEVVLAVVVSVPLGIGTAVYLAEVGDGALARVVRTVVEAMTALPEILSALFIYVTLIVGLGVPKSGFAAAVAMAVTMVPIIARSAEVGLRVVPDGLREAGLALGASHWSTVRRVVLPTARAGLTTSTILGVARGVGEVAIVLIVSGSSSFMNTNPFDHQMNSLTLFVYTSIKSGEPTAITRGFGAAAVLLTLVLILFGIARFLSREKNPLR